MPVGLIVIFQTNSKVMIIVFFDSNTKISRYNAPGHFYIGQFKDRTSNVIEGNYVNLSVD